MGKTVIEPTAYLGLGTNLGDRLANLNRGVRLLVMEGDVVLHGVAGLYESSPVGGPEGQSDYYNSVISVCTKLDPPKLLARLLAVECEMGRVRDASDGPRIIDIDLLMYGSTILNSPGLTLPHPRMHSRKFVLAPLAELAPQLIHPSLGVNLSELLSCLPPNEEIVVRIHTGHWLRS